LFGDQRQDHEPEVAVFQEPADPPTAMMSVTAPAAAHVAAPGMAAAVLVRLPEEMMMSVHIESPLLIGAVSIYLNRIYDSSEFRYV
jgi:hypothetical protein